MAVPVKVCTAGRCGPRRGNALILDIEEICGGRQHIEGRSCLGKYDHGPNVEVMKGFAPSKIHSGIKTHAMSEALVLSLNESLNVSGIYTGRAARLWCLGRTFVSLIDVLAVLAHAAFSLPSLLLLSALSFWCDRAASISLW